MRFTDKDRVFMELEDGMPHSSFQLMKSVYGSGCYGAGLRQRISELRRHNDILNFKSKKNPKKSWYILKKRGRLNIDCRMLCLIEDKEIPINK